MKPAAELFSVTRRASHGDVAGLMNKSWKAKKSNPGLSKTYSKLAKAVAKQEDKLRKS